VSDRARLIQRPSDVGAVLRHGWRFAAGVRGLIKQPSSLAAAEEAFRAAVASRTESFLESLDRLVWSVPDSPYVALLDHADIDATDLRHLVLERGIEHALGELRDAGVYVAYEEYTGAQPIARGSLQLWVEPSSFFNARERADLFGATGGTRTGTGSPVAISFADKRIASAQTHLRVAAYGCDHTTPTAVWYPCLPSAAGLGAVLHLAGAGTPPERWFSQIPTRMIGVPAAKRATNLLLPLVGRLSGARLPGPRHVPNSSPEPVIDWCVDALGRHGAARLVAYPSSAVLLASAARARGVRLDGLVVAMTGEPVTVGRRGSIEKTGATTAAEYGFMQGGAAGFSCPLETAERYHVNDGKLAVVGRRRQRADGVEVDAFLWTTLYATARAVFINVENDDYGTISRDDEPCSCLWGQLGSRYRVSDVRGMTKVVAGGVTVAGEVLERLVDHVLPAEVGGTPLDYQFAELDSRDRGILALRIDPRLGEVDEGAAIAVVVRELSRHEMGRLASAVWVPGESIKILRAAAVAAPSGKTLPFEPLGAAGQLT
jgi:hypothetical protein